MKPSSRWAEIAARLGYGARGLVFILTGGLAVLAALDLGRDADGGRSAFRAILEQPLGWIWLGAIGAGLAGFAVWRVLDALTDADRRGTSWKGLGQRGAHLVGGIVYAALAVVAISMAFGFAQSSREGDGAAQDWTAWLLDQPFGPGLVVGLGVAVAAAGLSFASKGWRGQVGEFLQTDAAVRRWAIPVARVGFVARGIAFGLVGLFLVLAGLHGNSAEARGLTGALASLQGQPSGWVLLAAVGLGLVAFGVFGLVQARHRRIEPPHLEDAPDAIARAMPTSPRAD